MGCIQGTDEAALRALYQQLMDAWNDGSAAAFAAAFTEDGDLIAFDGTHFAGRNEITTSHQELFDKWMKGTRLVGSVERVRFVRPDVAGMHAIDGTILRHRTKPAPERASIQTLIAARTEGQWLLTAFHNTRIRPIGRNALSFLIWTIGDRLWRGLRLSTDPSPIR